MNSALAAVTGLVAGSYAFARDRHTTIDTAGGWTFQGSEFSAKTADGATIRGATAGYGPTVVLSHCWTGDRSIWDAVAGRLVANGHRVVVYDQRGHGLSTTGSAIPSLEVLAADLRLVLDVCDVDDAVVAGHSLGGMTAMQATLPYRISSEYGVSKHVDRDPRITGLALVATSALPLAPLARHLGIGFLLSSLTGSRFADALIQSKAGALLARPAMGRRPSITARTRTLKTLRNTPRKVRGSQLRAIGHFNALKSLNNVPVPTQILVGTRDRLTPAGHAKAMNSALQNSSLTRLSKAGHMLPLECPDAVTEAIMMLRSAASTPETIAKRTPVDSLV